MPFARHYPPSPFLRCAGTTSGATDEPDACLAGAWAAVRLWRREQLQWHDLVEEVFRAFVAGCCGPCGEEGPEEEAAVGEGTTTLYGERRTRWARAVERRSKGGMFDVVCGWILGGVGSGELSRLIVRAGRPGLVE